MLLRERYQRLFFLTEYEHFTSHVNLTDEVKCEEIQIYFTKKEKQVLDILEGYAMLNWNNLKGQLRSLYMSSVERRIYQPQDIQHFIAKKRKISKLIHFDTYRCQFLVITAGLQAQSAISAYDCNDYFWSGIRPTSLRDVLENELRACNYWTDLTLPLPIEQVIEVAVKFLNRAIYHPRDVSLHSKWKSAKKKRCDSSLSESELSDDGASDLSTSSSEDELSSDKDEDEPDKKKKSTKKKSRVEKCEKSAKESKEEEKPSSEPIVTPNIEDLAERFKHLELKLGERGGQLSQPPKTQTTMYCIMCGQSGHGIRECSESKFFIAQGICRLNINNRVVMNDGTTLPHAEGDGGAAKQIRSRLAGNMPSVSGPTATSMSNVELVAAEG